MILKLSRIREAVCHRQVKRVDKTISITMASERVQEMGSTLTRMTIS